MGRIHTVPTGRRDLFATLTQGFTLGYFRFLPPGEWSEDERENDRKPFRGSYIPGLFSIPPFREDDRGLRGRMIANRSEAPKS